MNLDSMSTENILEKYEIAQREKFQRAESERQKDKMRRRFNAEAVEASIQEIIEPVLKEHRHKLVSSGYSCTVGAIQEQDSQYPDSKTVCAVEIKLSVSRRKETPISGVQIFLNYSGGYESQSIIKTVFIEPSLPSVSSPIPVETITRASIEKDVESFLSQVFDPSK